MRMMKLFRTVMVSLLTLMFCISFLPAACAADGTGEAAKYTLTMTFITSEGGLPGVKFDAWRVGVKTDRGWEVLESMEKYNVLQGPGELGDKAVTLLPYLQQDGVAPDSTALTGEDGVAQFDGLESGLYLVAGERHYQGTTYYTPTPVLLMVPDTSGQLEVSAKVKYNSGHTDPDPDPTVKRRVLKSWNDAGHTQERPQEVVVNLLRNGKVYDTVTLTAKKAWRHEWTGLDANSTWTITEEVPGDYMVLVEQKGITFKITNTWQEEPDPDDPPPLIDIPDDPPPKVDPPDDPTPDDPAPDDPVPDNPDDPTPVDPVPEQPLPDGSPPLQDPPDYPTDPQPEDVDVPDDPVPEDGGPMLPQTGQLWWPVLPMVVSGLVLSLLGWKRCRACDEADDSDEA